MAKLDIRLRAYSPSGAAGNLIRAESVDWTAPRSAPAALSFTASKEVAGKLALPLEVAVELWDGARWSEPEEGRFMAQRLNRDAVDAAGMQQINCVNWPWWQLSKAIVEHTGEDPLAYETTPGDLLRSLITQQKSIGWAPGLVANFGEVTASDGSTWPVESWTELEYQGGESLRAVLEGMLNLGTCQVATRGRELRLLPPVDGVDRTAGDSPVYVGTAATSAPIEESAEDLATHIWVKGSGKKSWRLPIPGADTSSGVLTVSVDAAGITTQAQAERMAAVERLQGKAVRRSWTATEDGASIVHAPFTAYSPGEYVFALVDNQWTRLQVAQVQVRKDADASVVVDVTLNDRIVDQLTRALKAAKDTAVTGVEKKTTSTGSGSSPTGIMGKISAGVWGTTPGMIKIEPIGGGEAIEAARSEWLQPTAGREVAVARHGGDWVALTPVTRKGPNTGGEIIDPGAPTPHPGVVELQLEAGFRLADEAIFGRCSSTRTEQQWIILSGAIVTPPVTSPAGTLVTILPVGHRPSIDIYIGDFWIRASGRVELLVAKSANSLICTDNVQFNARVEGLTGVSSTLVRGIDESGIAFALGFGNASGDSAFAAPFTQKVNTWRSDGRFSPNYYGQDGGFSSGGNSALRAVTLQNSSTWVQLTLENGWVHGGMHTAIGSHLAYGVLRIAKLSDRRAILNGEARGGLKEGRIAVIPEGFRPKHTKLFHHGSPYAGFRIEPDGGLWSEPVGTNQLHNGSEQWIIDH